MAEFVSARFVRRPGSVAITTYVGSCGCSVHVREPLELSLKRANPIDQGGYSGVRDGLSRSGERIVKSKVRLPVGD